MSEAQRYKLAQSVPYGDGAFVVPAGQVVVREADYQSVRDECERLRGLLQEIAFDCEHVGSIQHLDKAERQTWVSVANRIKAALTPAGSD